MLNITNLVNSSCVLFSIYSCRQIKPIRLICYNNCMWLFSLILLVRTDMDQNEHEKLSNTLEQKLKKMNLAFCCSTLHSHNRIFNNGHNSYPKNECEACSRAVPINFNYQLTHFELETISINKLKNLVMHDCDRTQPRYRYAKSKDASTRGHWIIPFYILDH